MPLKHRPPTLPGATPGRADSTQWSPSNCRQRPAKRQPKWRSRPRIPWPGGDRRGAAPPGPLRWTEWRGLGPEGPVPQARPVPVSRPPRSHGVAGCGRCYGIPRNGATIVGLSAAPGAQVNVSPMGWSPLGLPCMPPRGRIPERRRRPEKSGHNKRPKSSRRSCRRLPDHPPIHARRKLRVEGALPPLR